MKGPSIPPYFSVQPTCPSTSKPPARRSPSPAAAHAAPTITLPYHGPTGVPFVDMYLEGDDLAGKVCGLLAPDERLHEVLLAQLAARYAERFARTDPGKLACYITFFDRDLSMDQLVAAARSIQAPLAACDVPPFLCSNLRLGGFGGPWQGTAPRGENAVAWRIREGVEETVRETGGRVGAVFVDYLQAGCQQYLDCRGERDSYALTAMLDGLAADFRRVVAERFECPVWVNHFLNGTQSGKPPHVLPDAVRTSYSRTFADGLHYAFVFGVLDQSSRCCQFACRKAHGSALTAGPRILCMAAGGGILQDVTDQFRISRARRGIVPVTPTPS